MTITERVDRAVANRMQIKGEGRLTNGNRFWLVASETHPGTTYIVEDTGGQLACNCPATIAGCKHVGLIGRRLTAEFRAARVARIAAQAATTQAAPRATAAEKRERALPAWATAPERTESLVAGTPAYLWKPETHDDFQYASR